MTDVVSAGWRVVYRWAGVPMTPRKSGVVEASNRQETMSEGDTAAERGAQSDRERAARMMAEGELDRIGDRLIGASRDSESLRETVRECRAELAAVESMLNVDG